MLVCAALNPSLDKLFTCSEVVPGAIHRPDTFTARAGGKGLNVARAAHALGARVHAVALLAGHNGRRLEEMLEAEGVAVDAVLAPGETRASLSVLSQATGELTEFYEAGDPTSAPAWPAFCATLAERAAGASWVAMTGSLLPGIDPGGVGALVVEARRAGAFVAVDQDGPALAAALAARPELVKVNEREAHAVTGAPRAEACAALAALAGPQAIVVVTHGADGAQLRAPDGTTWRGDLEERGPYAVGSGDAFLGGFLVALERDRADLPGALAAGLGAGTANALVPGAGSLAAATARGLEARARGRIGRDAP